MHLLSYRTSHLLPIMRQLSSLLCILHHMLATGDIRYEAWHPYDDTRDKEAKTLNKCLRERCGGGRNAKGLHDSIDDGKQGQVYRNVTNCRPRHHNCRPCRVVHAVWKFCLLLAVGTRSARRIILASAAPPISPAFLPQLNVLCCCIAEQHHRCTRRHIRSKGTFFQVALIPSQPSRGRISTCRHRGVVWRGGAVTLWRFAPMVVRPSLRNLKTWCVESKVSCA